MFGAGVVLSGENYEGGARRELMEELGSNPDDLRPLFRHRYDGPDNAQWTQVFEATCRRPPVLRTGGDRVGWVHERSRPGGEAGGLAVRPGRSRGLPPLPRAEGLMRHHLVFGDGWVTASLPDDTRVVSPGISLPLPPTPNLHREVRRAASRPLDGPPLRELARGARRVTVAFDDPTVPCYA